MFASLYSDYASATLDEPARHRAGVGHREATSSTSTALSVQVGVFWDRFGYIEPYDTYIFGRTHQGGVKVAYALPGGGRVQAGIGFHEADLQQNLGLDADRARRGGVSASGPSSSARTCCARGRATSASCRRSRTARCTSPALDARYKLPDDRGTAYLAFALLQHGQGALPRARARGHALDRRPRPHRELPRPRRERRRHRPHVHARDRRQDATSSIAIGVRAFGMATWVRSPQVDEMDPLQQQGSPPLLQVGRRAELPLLPKLAASVRYDRVILDVYDSQDSFRVLSPKICVPARQLGRAVRQYSHYWYGDKIHAAPRPGPARDDARHRRVQAAGAGRLVISRPS